MKIAYLINEINVCGGTHKQFMKLLEYTERQNISFIVVTKFIDFDKTYPGFVKFKDRIIVYRPNDYPDILNHRYICRLIPFFQRSRLLSMVKDCDIVNVHDNGWIREMSWLSEKKVFWQVNDLPSAFNVGVHERQLDNERKVRDRELILKWTKNVKEFTVNVGKNAIRIKKCFNRDAHVFYCGVEPIDVKRNNFDSFKRFETKKINLLSSGVFFPYRNYETQIEVVRRLVEDGYDVELKIIGALLDRNYAEKIHGIIEDKDLTNRIHVLGQVSDEQFKDLHKHSDIFIFININQSWGLAVFEAMSCGLPVIVSESVGATEILNNGFNAIFVDPFNVDQIVDVVKRLVNDEDYYSRISNEARSFHEHWTWDEAYCSKMIKMMISNI